MTNIATVIAATEVQPTTCKKEFSCFLTPPGEPEYSKRLAHSH